MINAAPAPAGRPTEPEDLEAIVRAGPHGALTLAALATAIVVVIWFAFYLFVFVPRGALP